MKLNKSKMQEQIIILDNGKYIFDYFERKKAITKNTNKKQVLNSFFNISTEESKKQKQNEIRSNNDVNFLFAKY